MIMYPSLDTLLSKVDNIFILVTLALKRAKQLNSGAPKLIETSSIKPVSIALEEIAAVKIKAKTSTKTGSKS